MEPTVQAQAQNIGQARPPIAAERPQVIKSTQSKKNSTDSVWMDWLFMAVTVGAAIIVAALILITE
jgi:hypothetical protein